MSFNYGQLNWDFYIKKAGVTDQSIAENIGVSKQAVGQYRRKEKNPSKETARKLRELLTEHTKAQIRYHEKMLKELKFDLIAFDIHKDYQEKDKK